MQAKVKQQYQRILEEKKPFLLTVAGSELLGLAAGDKTDRDEVGVYVEDMREIAGFGSEQHVVWRSAEARTGNPEEPSKAGDVDLTLYGLKKFLWLALGGNPTILNLFYAPMQSHIHMTELGLELQALVPSIISKKAGNAFLGYLNQQRLRLVGERGQRRVSRVDAAGYDTKYAMHMVRLGVQGKELLEKGKLEIPITEEGNWRNYLIGIRKGNETLNDVLSNVTYLEDSIRQLMEASTLPAKPDYDKVEDWLLKVYKQEWK